MNYLILPLWERSKQVNHIPSCTLTQRELMIQHILSKLGITTAVNLVSLTLDPLEVLWKRMEPNEHGTFPADPETSRGNSFLDSLRKYKVKEVFTW